MFYLFIIIKIHYYYKLILSFKIINFLFYIINILENILIGNLNRILCIYSMQYLFPYIKINEKLSKKKKNLFTFELFTEL